MWMPALVVLGVSGVIGLVLAMRVRPGGAPLPADPTLEEEELKRRKEALFQEILSLEDSKARLSPEAFEAEHLRLRLDAARALKALASRSPAPTPAPAPAPVPEGPPSWARRNPVLSTAVFGGVAGLFGAGLMYLLMDATHDRAPGGSITGGNGMGGGGSASAEASFEQQLNAALAEAQAKVDAAPKDVAALNRLGHLQLMAGQLDACFKTSEATVALQPTDAEARTHQAVVLLQSGHADMAVQVLDKVLSMDANFVEALAYRGALYLQDGKKDEAIAAWERAIAADPDAAPQLEPLIARAKSGASMAGLGGGEAASGPPLVRGTLTLAAGVTPPPGAVVFVMARPSGQDRGMPVAVKRLPADTFPLDFTLLPSDNPTGAPFPASATLTARIDTDGNPTTNDGVGEAKIEGLQAGASGVTLELQPGGAATATPPTSSAPAGISGTIALAAGVTPPPGAIVFVMARPAGQERGMPAAVKKVPAAGFPISFTLGPEDNPMGQPFPASATVTARIDTDGDATTNDGVGEAKVPVTAGATGVTLTLTKP